MKLEELREKRGFNTEQYLVDKVKAINDFFRNENLDSAVIGLSGGIDSAVVVALLCKAAQEKYSPLKKILGISMPIYTIGVTGQYTATDVVQNDFVPNYLVLFEQFEYRWANLTKAMQGYLYAEDVETPFTVGQLAAIVRTPYLYFSVAKLQSRGYNPIVVGTTNRDEGAYIGFFGKASDAMVDLQPIADIHKSEVYKLANLLGISESIINRTPVGDVFDGSTDYDLIGASYDNVEYFQLLDDYNIPRVEGINSVSHVMDKLAIQDEFTAIMNIHKKNAHKYKVGLPSRFIDVMLRKTNKNGGW